MCGEKTTAGVPGHVADISQYDWRDIIVEMTEMGSRAIIHT